MNNTIIAEKIISDIENHMDGKTHILEYNVENPVAVRQAVYKRLSDFPQKVVVKYVPEYRSNLIVNIKGSKVLEYERLLREALGHIDNEKLYEEILNAITITI